MNQITEHSARDTQLRDKISHLNRLKADLKLQYQQERAASQKQRPKSAAPRSNVRSRTRKGQQPRHWEAYKSMQNKQRQKKEMFSHARVAAANAALGGANDDRTDEVVEKLKQKISQYTRGDHDRIRQACRAFGDQAGAAGVNVREFRLGLMHWNIPLTKQEARLVFSRLDRGAKGHIDVYHLFRQLFPHTDDFPEEVWYNHSESETFKKAQKDRAKKAESGHTGFVDKQHFTDDELLSRLREQINKRSRCCADRMRKAYRLFNAAADGSSRGVPFRTFHHALMVQFGLRVDEKQSRRLFDYFDSGGKGHLLLQDLVHKLFPRSHDYPVKLWYVRADEQRVRHEKVKSVERQCWEERVPLPTPAPSTFAQQQSSVRKLAMSASTGAGVGGGGGEALRCKKQAAARGMTRGAQRHRPHSASATASGARRKWVPGESNWLEKSVGTHVTHSRQRQLPWTTRRDYD